MVETQRINRFTKRINRGELNTIAALKALSELPDSPGGPVLRSALYELNRLVGLDQVKEVVLEIKAYLEIQQKRAACGLRSSPQMLHMIFKGNPGTGKTTVARLLGQIFKGLGVLPRGHLVEVERADLVGEYIGQTAQKTREKLKDSRGGILFVDEAYSLGRGGEKDFGKEAIDVLVKGMEDWRSEFILVLAGYRLQMSQFVALNPGLSSRFPLQIDFPDYTVHELLAIADMMATERHYQWSPAARLRLERYLANKLLYQRPHFSNARLVRNILEKSLRRQALRLSRRENLSREDLVLIDRADLAVEDR
ncbi:MAG: AAA family ATPase [Firmicutes bacterium]|nr:AAA family ATPase [Bacillota bacterium]